jgi:hypothetical protein
MPDTSFLDDALGFASGQVRHHVADALACHLHNEGYALEGNTEANDIEWFARNLYENGGTSSWDRAPESSRGEYRAIARNVLLVLPRFQERVAHRLISLSKVVREIERALRPPRKR